MRKKIARDARLQDEVVSPAVQRERTQVRELIGNQRDHRGWLRSIPTRQRRKNVDAAAFVVFQSVRATMLAWMLERPPGLDEETLIREVVDLVLCYLVPQARVESRDGATGTAR